MQALFLFAFATRLVSALQLTEPAGESTLLKGQTYDVSWSSVSSDPSSFTIFVVNYATYPPVAVKLASNVQTSAGSASVTIPCDIRTDGGFQM